MKRYRSTAELFCDVIDQGIWGLFLSLIVVVSFINSTYGEPGWYLVSSAVFLLCFSVCAHMMLSTKVRTQGLIKARYLLLTLGLSLLLLLLQVVLGFDSSVFKVFDVSAEFPLEKPSWFEAHSKWSVVPPLTMHLFWSELTMICCLLLTLVLVRSRQRLKHLLWLFCLIGLLHSSVGIFAKYANIILVDNLQIDGHFSPARGWFVNRNHFASFICLTLIGSLSFQLRWLINHNQELSIRFFVSQIVSLRSLVLLMLFISFVAILLSQSRAGFLSTILSIAIVVGLLNLNSKVLNNQKVLILGLLFVVGMSFLYFGSDFLARINFDSGVLGERKDQWLHTLSLIKQEWFLGYGGNSYATVYQATRGNDNLRELIYNQAHNDYLHIWLEQGLIGLLLWFAILYQVYRRIWATLNKTGSSLISAVMITCLMVVSAALLQSFVGFNLQILNIRFYFFVIIGLVFVAPTIRHSV